MDSHQHLEFIRGQGNKLLTSLPAAVRSRLRHYEVAAVMPFQPCPPLRGCSVPRCFAYVVVSDWSLLVVALSAKQEARILLELPLLLIDDVVSCIKGSRGCNGAVEQQSCCMIQSMHTLRAVTVPVTCILNQQSLLPMPTSVFSRTYLVPACRMWMLLMWETLQMTPEAQCAQPASASTHSSSGTLHLTGSSRTQIGHVSLTRRRCSCHNLQRNSCHKSSMRASHGHLQDNRLKLTS